MDLKLSIVLLALLCINHIDADDLFKLPSNVVPNHYTLEVITNLGDDDNNFQFDAKVTIEITAGKEGKTNNITLNSKGLTIHKHNITVKDLQSNELIKIADFSVDKERDWFTIQVEGDLEGGHKYEVFIPFNGTLMDSLDGFYRSSYVDKMTNTTKYLAITQFEPLYARKAFPCFDEPAMKATYSIRLGRKEKYSTASNMPLLKTEPIPDKPGWVLDIYQKSVPMSTYLVAYMVSEFSYRVSEPQPNNVTFRIWARKDALDQVEFAREIGPKFLSFYEDFFDIKFPLPKQDMVAIPDFNSGAMENWGLITYRESLLLFDPKLSSFQSKERLTGVVAHELAHQWFGNLVTMKWWTDLWLNEGFATYMQEVALHKVFPEWKTLDGAALNKLHTVYTIDSLNSSHPISVPIRNPSDIEEIFDEISYQKGSCVIRMMALFLGETAFREGVSNYLKKHEYGNAEQDDLWTALTQKAHEHKVLPQNLTVKTIMDTWTLQTGYPILNITREYGKRAANIQQVRYSKKRESHCWWVPLVYTTEDELNFNSTKPKHWLECNNEKQRFEGFPEDNKWVIFNVLGTGLYRVNYDEQNWNMLIKTLNSEKFEDISVFSRVQLLEDSNFLARSGDIKYDILFDLHNYLGREKEYIAWNAGFNTFGKLRMLMKRTANFGYFEKYMNKLLTNVYANQGGLEISKEIINDLEAVKKHTQISDAACIYNVADCRKTAIRLFREKQKGNDTIHPELRRQIYCTAIENGGQEEWDYLWEQYLKSNVASEKTSILSALGCTPELPLLERYLKWSITPKSGIRAQDSTLVYSSVASHTVGYPVATKFFKENIDAISEWVKKQRLSRYLMAYAKYINTEAENQEFNKFVQDNKDHFSHVQQGVERSKETALLNVQWADEHYKYVSDLLQKYAKDNSSANVSIDISIKHETQKVL